VNRQCYSSYSANRTTCWHAIPVFDFHHGAARGVGENGTFPFAEVDGRKAVVKLSSSRRPNECLGSLGQAAAQQVAIAFSPFETRSDVGCAARQQIDTFQQAT